MTITATTLTAALTSSGTTLTVASATYITAPNNQTGSGITFLRIEQEMLAVTAVSGTLISVLRGQNGTVAAAHASGAGVFVGLPTDFPTYTDVLQSASVSVDQSGAKNQPATNLTGSADAIDATVPGFYVVTTAGVDAMTLAAPTAAQEGNIIEVWSQTAYAHTITATSLIAAGVSAKTTITFPAYAGAGVRLRACNLLWHLLSGGGSATNGGPVVLT